MTDHELDWSASVDADLAFLAAQQAGETTAECVRIAIRAYLDSATQRTDENGVPVLVGMLMRRVGFQDIMGRLHSTLPQSSSERSIFTLLSEPEKP